MTLGPDASRYVHLANGVRVPRPFVWRWLLPTLCRDYARRWLAVWFASWVLLAVGMMWFAWLRLDAVWPALTAAVFVVGLPGILGPTVVNPIGVDLFATAFGVLGAGCAATGTPAGVVVGVGCVLVAGSTKETAPVFAALWAWSPWLLIGFAAPAARYLWVRWHNLEGPDPLGADFQQIADQPFQAGWNAHRFAWRDGWAMVAPWGACLIALYAPSWQIAAVLAVAYAQLLVATDTVRLVHHAAAPTMAVAAVAHIPSRWLLPAAVAHFFWFRKPERI